MLLSNHDSKDNQVLNNDNDQGYQAPCFQWITMKLCHSDDECFVLILYKRKNTLIESRIRHVIESGEVMRFSARETEAIRLVAILEESLQIHFHSSLERHYMNAIKNIAEQFNKK